MAEQLGEALAVASVVAETARQSRGRTWGELAPLLAPTATLEGFTSWLFDTRATGSVFRAGSLPGPAYLVVAIGIIIANLGEVPAVLALIFKSAFGLHEAAAGGIGAAILNGFKRGLFSNEAGMGSAPNAAAALLVPVRHRHCRR